MFSTKQKIVEYHEKLANEIDIQTEKAILRLSQNDNGKEQIPTINSIRENLLTKVKEIERLNARTIKKFCFFIPNEQQIVYEANTPLVHDWNLLFRNQIGVLVIVNEVLSDKVLKELK